MKRVKTGGVDCLIASSVIVISFDLLWVDYNTGVIRVYIHYGVY